MTELGNKHECLGCGTKFYDLGKSELVCPKCGENQKDLAEAQEASGGKDGKRKKTSSKAKSKGKKKAKKKAPVKEPAPEPEEKAAKGSDSEPQETAEETKDEK